MEPNNPYIQLIGYDPYNSVNSVGHELQRKRYAIRVGSLTPEQKRLRQSPGLTVWYLDTKGQLCDDG